MLIDDQKKHEDEKKNHSPQPFRRQILVRHDTAVIMQ
jgi:hypothetical protein